MNKDFDYKLISASSSPNVFKFLDQIYPSSRQTRNRKIRSISCVRISHQTIVKKPRNYDSHFELEPRGIFISNSTSGVTFDTFDISPPRANSRSFLRYILARGSHPRNKRPSFWPRAKDDPWHWSSSLIAKTL